MGNLTDFLAEHPVDHLREEVLVSPRLKEYPFEIKGVTVGEMEEYSNLCRRREQGNSYFDGGKFNLLLILNHCVSPDFRSVELLEKCGCATPEEAVNRMLKAGEISVLAKAIYRLSGYGESIATLKEQVKNA